MYARQISEKTQFEQNWNGFQTAQKGYESASQAHENARQAHESAQQTHNSARQMYETADRAEKAADVKIATGLAKGNEARKNVEKAETGIEQGQGKVQTAQEIREKKRAFIIGKLDEAKTLLDNKIMLVSQSNGMPSKENILTKLNNFLSENDKLKKETQTAKSLEEVTQKMTTFSKDLNILLKQIGKV